MIKDYNQYYTSSLFNIDNVINYELKTTFINVFTKQDLEVFSKINNKIVIYNSELYFFDCLSIVDIVIKSGIDIYSDNIKIRKYLLKNEIKPKFINKKYSWIDNNKLLKLKLKCYPNKDTIIICINYLYSSCLNNLIHLIELIKKLRNSNDVKLLIIDKIDKNNLTKTYNEIINLNLSWVKLKICNQKDILNYYRICDIFISTNNINEINEYLLSNKHILCPRNKYTEQLLGINYFGLYDESNIYDKLKIIINFDWYFYGSYYNDVYNEKLSKNDCLDHYFNIGNFECRKYKQFISDLDDDIPIIINYEKNLKSLINKDIKIVAVIPVNGREPLLKYTIRRLYTKNNLFKVICVGINESEKKVVLEENGIWIYHENYPLGKKWNSGFLKAKEYNPDAILFVGSSDWISHDWIPSVYDYINHFGIIGKSRFDMIDFNNKNYKTCYWNGYNENNIRHNETIGIGRLISNKLLKKINYKPFDENMNNSMDWYMYKNCINNDFRIKKINNNSIFLSISCDLWKNKHLFEDHYLAANKNYDYLKNIKKYNDFNIDIYLPSYLHTNIEYTNLLKLFPEINEFYNDYLEIVK